MVCIGRTDDEFGWSTSPEIFIHHCISNQPRTKNKISILAFIVVWDTYDTVLLHPRNQATYSLCDDGGVDWKFIYSIDINTEQKFYSMYQRLELFCNESETEPILNGLFVNYTMQEETASTVMYAQTREVQREL